MDLTEAQIFVSRFEKGAYTPGEYAAFLQWLEGASMDEINIIADEQEALALQWSLPAAGPSSEWAAQLEQKLDRTSHKRQVGKKAQLGHKRQAGKKEQAVIKKMVTGRKLGWVAAASLVGLLAGGGYLWYSHQAGPYSHAAGSGPRSSDDVAVLSKSFTNPKGSDQRELDLTDGTKVWLNAASTLRYPASFTGKERKVELSGEAYFEIAKNADMPFRVKIRDASIEVLGTHFNVMAYEDEPLTRTTLVEGLVKVARGTEALLLQPGEQAEIVYPSTGAQAAMRLIQGTVQSEILAWREGELEFNNDDLHTVMREVARRYDVEVAYDGKIPEKRFTGKFSKKDGLSQILQQLKFQHIHFSITGKTITIVS